MYVLEARLPAAFITSGWYVLKYSLPSAMGEISGSMDYHRACEGHRVVEVLRAPRFQISAS